MLLGQGGKGLKGRRQYIIEPFNYRIMTVKEGKCGHSRNDEIGQGGARKAGDCVKNE